jgi:hypothetical protein
MGHNCHRRRFTKVHYFKMMVIKLAASPGQFSFWGILGIPAWAEPWAALLVSTVFTGRKAFLAHLAGIIAGYLYAGGFVDWIIPSAQSFGKFEGKLPCLTTTRRYVSVNGDVAGLPPGWGGRDDSGRSSPSFWADAFRDRGRRIGDSPPPLNAFQWQRRRSRDSLSPQNVYSPFQGRGRRIGGSP